MLLIGLGRFALPLLASDETVARLAVDAGFVAAVMETGWGAGVRR
jgi:hypothetical protein